MEGRINELERKQKETSATMATMATTLAVIKPNIAKLESKVQSRSRHTSHTSHHANHSSHRSSEADIAKLENKVQSRSRHTSHTSHHANHSPHRSSESSCHRSYHRSSHQSSLNSSTDISSHSRKTRLRRESSSSPKDSHNSLSSSKAVSRNSANSKTEELPLFYEDEAYEWIERMERYFGVQAIAERFKVDTTAKAMGEEACGWFQWWDFQKREDCWEALKEDLIRDFPPTRRQKTGKKESQELSRRSRRTSSSSHSSTRTNVTPCLKLSTSPASHYYPSSSQVVSLCSPVLLQDCFVPAQEIIPSIKEIEREPIESGMKKTNKDKIEEQTTFVGILKSETVLQVKQTPDYASPNLAIDMELTPSRVSNAGLLVHPCSFGSRVLIAYEIGAIKIKNVSDDKAVLIKSQEPRQPREMFSEYSGIGKRKSGLEAQEDHVDLLLGEFAIMFGNRKPIDEDDKSNHFQHLDRSSLQLATVIVKDLSGVKEAELQPIVDSMINYHKFGLHNPLKALEGYLKMGDITAKTVLNLSLPDVFDIFTKSITEDGS